MRWVVCTENGRITKGSTTKKKQRQKEGDLPFFPLCEMMRLIISHSQQIVHTQTFYIKAMENILLKTCGHEVYKAFTFPQTMKDNRFI